MSAATNFVNYHDVSGNAAQRNADYINKVKLMSYAQLEKRHVETYRKQFATSSLVLPADINASLPTNQRLEKFAGSKDMAMVHDVAVEISITQQFHLQFGTEIIIERKSRAAAPGFGVGSAVHHPAQAAIDDAARAHGAGF